MFTKILIANRGEIACRIIKTAKRLGIQCVAVYSEADSDALHVKIADEAYCIGPAPALESYLQIDKIISIAQKCNAQAIHPGYGFLSENSEFAEQCFANSICFIGPSATAIRLMGSKSAAKKIMAKTHVPLIPGYHEDAQDIPTLQIAANKIGYPILIKPSAGGGGKGMRIVHHAGDFIEALAATQREAKNSFNDSQVLIEKYFINSRHIEIQIFADTHDNYVYLFERECSIQRRHQKIIEEAPAPGISASLREKMGKVAIEAARAIDYVGAGTIEFLLDENQNFYFMEMNTRLQVEHPITEMITGQDLVEWQLKVAAGEPLPLKQTQLKINGHAFEARIYAEDPNNDFLPSIGKIKYLVTPSLSEYVRVDTGITETDSISHYYDPMLAKLITWDMDRSLALHRLQQALAEYHIVGVNTNLNLLNAIIQITDFTFGKYNTSFIQKHGPQLISNIPLAAEVLALASLYILLLQKNKMHGTDIYSPWNITDNWRLNLTIPQLLKFEHIDQMITIGAEYKSTGYELLFPKYQKVFINGEISNNHTLTAIINHEEHIADIFIEHNKLNILYRGYRYQLNYVNNDAVEYSNNQLSKNNKLLLISPMPGKIIATYAKAGDYVKAGSKLMIVEAMKMEHIIYAPSDGIIKACNYQIGDIVSEGVELLTFEEK